MRVAHTLLIPLLLSAAASAAPARSVIQTHPKLKPAYLAFLISDSSAEIRQADTLARQGNPLAKVTMGYLNLIGYNHPRDMPAAIRAFSDPALTRNAAALNGLISAYTQPGPTADFPRAYATARRLAEIDPDGLAIAGYFRTRGQGTPKDVRAGLGDIAEALNKGSAAADYFTAMDFFTGTNRAKDQVKADIYLRSALRKGYAPASLFYGNALITAGSGYSRNLEGGFRLIQQALRGGAIDAGYALALHRADPPGGYAPQLKEALADAERCGNGLNPDCNYLAATLRMRQGAALTDPKVRDRLRRAALKGHLNALSAYFARNATPRITSADEYALLTEAAHRKYVTPEVYRRLDAAVPASVKTAAQPIATAVRAYADQFARTRQ